MFMKFHTENTYQKDVSLSYIVLYHDFILILGHMSLIILWYESPGSFQPETLLVHGSQSMKSFDR